MKQFVLIAVVTIIGFGAGLPAGIWWEKHRPLPGPPAPFMGEFGQQPRKPPTAGSRRDRPINRAELIARIEAIKPQLDAYQSRVSEIDAEFDRRLQTVFTPEQQKKHEEGVRRRHAPRPEDTRPLTDDQISYYYRELPGRSVLWDVVITMRLDQLTREYKLEDDQREKIRGFLHARRDQFLALVDSSPPPSVVLSRLAPLVQRLAPAKPAAETGPGPAAAKN